MMTYDYEYEYEYDEKFSEFDSEEFKLLQEIEDVEIPSDDELEELLLDELEEDNFDEVSEEVSTEVSIGQLTFDF